jgi:hypothetical protein
MAQQCNACAWEGRGGVHTKGEAHEDPPKFSMCGSYREASYLQGSSSTADDPAVQYMRLGGEGRGWEGLREEGYIQKGKHI